MYVIAPLLAVLLATQIAFAGSLPPGKPAGVRIAVSQSRELFFFGVAGLAAVGFGFLLLRTDKSAGAATATSP